MWISKERFYRLEKKIADLEIIIQDQQKKINQINHPYESLRQAFEADVHLPENESKEEK